MEYEVVWRIDVDGKSVKQAAQEALRVQRDVGSTAVVFEVTAKGRKPAKTVLVDLDK
jgi:hypothetical protein